MLKTKREDSSREISLINPAQLSLKEILIESIAKNIDNNYKKLKSFKEIPEDKEYRIMVAKRNTKVREPSLKDVITETAIKMGKVNDRNFSRIVALNPKRERLSLSGLTQLKEEVMEEISKLKCLTYLNLCSCVQLPAKKLPLVTAECQRIKELYLDYCVDFDDETLRKSLKSLSKLEVLSLKGVYSVSDKTIQELSERCKHSLKSISLAYCQYITDRSLQLLSRCLNLQEIDLTYCVQLTGDGIEELVTNLSKLEKIILKGCSSSSPIDQKKEINSKTLKKLCCSCPRLRVLDVSGCAAVDDDGLRAIGQGQGLSHLVELHIDGTRMEREETAKLIAKVTHNELKILTLAKCVGVKKNTIKELIKDCKELEELDLDWLPVDEDILINSIGEKMKKLSISFCRDETGRELLTTESIKSYIKKATRLKQLCIFGFEDIDISSILRDMSDFNRIDIYPKRGSEYLEQKKLKKG